MGIANVIRSKCSKILYLQAPVLRLVCLVPLVGCLSIIIIILYKDSSISIPCEIVKSQRKKSIPEGDRLFEIVNKTVKSL